MQHNRRENNWEDKKGDTKIILPFFNPTYFQSIETECGMRKQRSVYYTERNWQSVDGAGVHMMIAYYTRHYNLPLGETKRCFYIYSWSPEAVTQQQKSDPENMV